MSLFIGNITSDTKESDLKDLFKSYGPCSISMKNNYAFADYDNYKDAEKALEKCNRKEVAGAVIEVRWSARMKKERAARHRDHHSSRRDKYRRSRSRSRSSRSRSRSREKRREERRRRRHERRSHSRSRRERDRKRS